MENKISMDLINEMAGFIMSKPGMETYPLLKKMEEAGIISIKEPEAVEGEVMEA